MIIYQINTYAITGKTITMKTKIHIALLYPLVLIFSSFLKGKKKEYKQFFKNKEKIEKKDILKVTSKKNEFYEFAPSQQQKIFLRTQKYHPGFEYMWASPNCSPLERAHEKPLLAAVR